MVKIRVRSGRGTRIIEVDSDATKWYLKGPMMFVWLILLVSFVILVYYSIIIYKQADNCSGCLA